MKFLGTSNLYSLNKSTYINLRWISYTGQLTAILIVEFYLKFEFNYLVCISIVFLSILTNLYLIFKIKYQQLNNFIVTTYLSYDIAQLGLLFYLTGGITNPFIFLIIIPSVFFCPIFKYLEFCSISYIYKFNFNSINLFLFPTASSRNSTFSCSRILFIQYSNINIYRFNFFSIFWS